MQEGGLLEVATTVALLGRVICIPILMFLYGSAVAAAVAKNNVMNEIAWIMIILCTVTSPKGLVISIDLTPWT